MSIMSIKPSTKSYNDSSSTSEIQKRENVHNLSAQDQEKLNGNVGDILNQIADPHYVSPDKKVRTVGNDKLDKDAFMKLMIAQMKNQDPTNPLKSHEMAAQLAQFTSVEQMMNMNQNLQDLKNMQKPNESFQTLAFIGKSVSGDSSKFYRSKGDREHELSFQIPENAKEVNIKIQNQNGETLKEVQLNNLKKGDNAWKWSGDLESGAGAPVGSYTFSIEAKGENDKKLAVKTDFEGTITGVNFTNQGTVLLIGNQTIKLKDVKKIIDPKVSTKDSEVNPIGPKSQTDNRLTQAQMDLKKSENAVDNRTKERELTEKAIKNTNTGGAIKL